MFIKSHCLGSIPHEAVIIEGIEVLFPFKPYEPQIAYMTSGSYLFLIDLLTHSAM